MPLTLPTHPMAVLPLKLWRPRWFDGVALVVGAVSLDIPYAFYSVLPLSAHTWLGPLWWSVPLALLVTPVIRWTAPVVAAHLPDLGRLALRDFAVLGRVRHRWWITASSAALGGISHRLWDLPTHPAYLGGWIRAEAVPGWPWWSLLNTGSDLFGFAGAAALVGWIGWTGALRRWHGDPPRPEPRPWVFWPTVGVVLAFGGWFMVAQPPPLFSQQAVRALLVGCAAVVAARAAVDAHALMGRAGRGGAAARHDQLSPTRRDTSGLL